MEDEKQKLDLNKQATILFGKLRNQYSETEKQYKREIEMLPQRETKLYISATIFMLLLFLGFGFKPQWDRLTSLREYNQQLSEHRSTLENRIEKIEELRIQLKAADPYIPNFNSIMPQDSNLEDYLVEYVQAVSQANFIMERLSQRQNNEGGITVSSSLTGENRPEATVELVTNIENLERISKIESFNIQFGANESKATVNISIYSLEALQQ